MKFFEKPIVEIVRLTVEDIVTTSGGEEETTPLAMIPPCMG